MTINRMLTVVLTLASMLLFGCATRGQNMLLGATAAGTTAAAATGGNPWATAIGVIAGGVAGSNVPGADELVVPQYGGGGWSAPPYQPRSAQDCANIAGGNTPVYQSCLKGLADARDREQRAAEQRAYEFGSGTPGGAQYTPRPYYAPAPPVYVPPSFYYAPTPRYGHPYGPWRGW